MRAPWRGLWSESSCLRTLFVYGGVGPSILGAWNNSRGCWRSPSHRLARLSIRLIRCRRRFESTLVRLVERKQMLTNSVGMRRRLFEYPGGLEPRPGVLAEPLPQTGQFVKTAFRRSAPMPGRSGAVCEANINAYEHCWYAAALVQATWGLGTTAARLAEPLSQTGRFANAAYRGPAPVRERSGTVCRVKAGA